MQTPLIRLHGIYPYDRSAKARWILCEAGIPHENRWLDPETREFEKPEFLKLNPMGRIPVAEIGDEVMFESTAICATLADRFLEKGLAPALTSPLRSVYQQWMFFAEATLGLFQSKIMIIEDIPASELRTEKESALLSDLRDAMTAMDCALSKHPFLVTDRFTAADACVGYHAFWCTLWPELDGVIQEFPRVTAYLERLKAMPSAVKADVFSYQE